MKTLRELAGLRLIEKLTIYHSREDCHPRRIKRKDGPEMTDKTYGLGRARKKHKEEVRSANRSTVHSGRLALKLQLKAMT